VGSGALMAMNRDMRKQSFSDLEIDPRILADVPAGNNGQLAVVTDQVGMRLYVRIGGTLVPAIDASSSPGVALLDGKAGGQILHGGTAASENLVLRSTFHSTKGYIDLQDRVTNSLGILNLGTAATSSQGYGVGSVLLGGNLEVKGQGAINTVIATTQIRLRTHCDLTFGNNEYVRFWDWSTTEQFGLALHAEFGNALIIHQDQARALKDYDHAPTTDPTIFIHSALNPDTNNTRWGSFSHSGTSSLAGAFTLTTGSGVIVVGRTVTPPVNFDSTNDVVVGGSLYVSGDRYGFRCGGNVQSDLAVIGSIVGINAFATSVGSITAYGGLQASEDNGLHLYVKSYEGVANNNVILVNSLNMYKNHGHNTSSIDPTFFCHSSVDPTVVNTRWGSFSHSGTSGAAGSFDIRSGSGPIILGTTTTPPSGFADTGDVATGGDWYVAGSYALGKRSIFVPSSVNSVAASSGITSSMLDKTLIKIQGDGGAVDITANPQIVDGVDGQVIILKGDHNTNTVQIDDGDGVALNNGTAFVMGKGDVLKLYYDGTDDIWYEISRSKNS